MKILGWIRVLAIPGVPVSLFLDLEVGGGAGWRC